jgi:hypothetical protein
LLIFGSAEREVGDHCVEVGVNFSLI